MEEETTFLESFLEGLNRPDPTDITFSASRDSVTVEDPEGRVLARWGLTDFYDAIPGAPDRGPCRLEYGGRTISVECACREWEQWNGVRDELVEQREFIPLEDWINEYAESWQLFTAFNNLQSQKA